MYQLVIHVRILNRSHTQYIEVLVCTQKKIKDGSKHFDFIRV